MKSPRLTIKLTTWKKLIRQLKKRGYGRRETGAFLLGKTGSNMITNFICYDDLDPHAFDSGIIEFNGDGYIPLWDYCSKHNVKILADVHTHPGGWTEQSGLDQRHPMIAQKGHIALILPYYATKRSQLLNGVGFHEFLGKGRWKSHSEKNNIIELVK